MNPDYWIEIAYHDGRRLHSPFIGSRTIAYDRCARLVAMDHLKLIEFVILLSGDYIPGNIATIDQILGDWQGEPIKGSRPYPLEKIKNPRTR